MTLSSSSASSFTVRTLNMASAMPSAKVTVGGTIPSIIMPVSDTSTVTVRVTGGLHPGERELSRRTFDNQGSRPQRSSR